MGFDVIFLTQHYCLYAANNKKLQDESDKKFEAKKEEFIRRMSRQGSVNTMEIREGKSGTQSQVEVGKSDQNKINIKDMSVGTTMDTEKGNRKKGSNTSIEEKKVGVQIDSPGNKIDGLMSGDNSAKGDTEGSNGKQRKWKLPTNN